MKVNWAYLKKPSVLIGAVVLFFILLFLLNRSGGSSAGSGTTVVNSGPTDAQVAAQTQFAMAQLGASVQGQAIQSDYAKSQDANQTQIALATIAAAANAQQLVASQSVAMANIAAQSHGMDLAYQTQLANNAASIQGLQVQAGTLIAQSAINANLQAHISDNQTAAYGYQIAASAIQSAKKGDRDQLTAALIGSMSGAGVSYGTPGAKGSVVVSPTSHTGSTSTIVNIPTNFLTPAGGGLT